MNDKTDESKNGIERKRASKIRYLLCETTDRKAFAKKYTWDLLNWKRQKVTMTQNNNINK